MTKPINSFPGYEFINGKNMFRGIDLGRGGYVYAEPGIYGNVALLDVESLHPNSAIQLNYFGEYTDKFKDILQARLEIKHGNYEKARELFDGKLAKYLTDESTAKDLAQALKIAINSVYGLTSATFDNPFRDIRNKNNIVALRGALFMKTLQDEVSARGFIPCHIKTDSIKIPDATPEIIQFCKDFAKKYGYTFAHEATYERMCLVNDAVYIAKYQTAEYCQNLYGYVPDDCKKKGGKWTATGTQFQVPYVFKKLFSKEPIEFADLCETKSVQAGAIYLDMNEDLPDVSAEEKEFSKLLKDLSDISKLNDPMTEECQKFELLDKIIADGHRYIFVGRVGQFCPIKPGRGGGVLYRYDKNKYYAVAGTKGFRWKESAIVKDLGLEDDIDISYYNKLVDDAANEIAKYGDFEWFVSDDPYVGPPYKDGKPVYLDFGTN